MDNLVERFKKLDTTCVSDAMDKIGIECSVYGVKPIQRGEKLCGRAFTIHYVPCGAVKGTVGDFLDDVELGQVIVIDNAGRDNCTVWGDIVLGDDTGVVIIPQSRAEEVADIAENIDRKEQDILALVAKGYKLKEARAVTGYHHLQTKEEA